MGRLSLDAMRDYLRRSISSLNANKLNGLLAEVALRQHLLDLGLGDRISPGGWIARSKGEGIFAAHTAVLFAEKVEAGIDYAATRVAEAPSPGLLTVSSSFQQAGITPYHCTIRESRENDPGSIIWEACRMGVAQLGPVAPFPACLQGFAPRGRKHSFLHYNTDASTIPDSSVEEEFSKEHLRVTLQTALMAELSDVDGVFYGNQFAYPLEIKEKTAGSDKGMGHFFGLDLGPFVKLAFYGAKRGQLHSLFVVREIDSPTTRREVGWWFIKFEDLAQCASWNPRAGGRSMTGGSSTVVMVPKRNFTELNYATISQL